MTSRLMTLCTVLLALLAPAAHAQQNDGGPPDGNAPRDRPEANGAPQQQSPEMFQKMKSAMLDMHQKRIKILQDGSACIQAATTRDQLRSCRDQERDAQEQLRPQGGRQRGGYGRQEGNEPDEQGGHGRRGQNQGW